MLGSRFSMDDDSDFGGIVVYARNRALKDKRDPLLVARVDRIRSIVLFKTRAILWLWSLIPLAVLFLLPPMAVPLGWRGMVVYAFWAFFGMLFYYVVIKPSLKKPNYPRSEDHAKGFAVGFQPDFWQWKLFQESRDDLKEISERLGIWPRPTMAMKSISPSGFAMVSGTEDPHESACVIFPTRPSQIQWGFSRQAHRGVLVHECGHIILSTAMWSRKFEMLNFVLCLPLTFLFSYLFGQIAAYQGVSPQDWQEVSGWFFTLQLPLISAIMSGKLAERIVSRIHEFGCDAITAVCGEGEGLVEAFRGFGAFTRLFVSKLPWNKKLSWYALKVPYREIWGTHPSIARRVQNCRAHM